MKKLLTWTLIIQFIGLPASLQVNSAHALGGFSSSYDDPSRLDQEITDPKLAALLKRFQNASENELPPKSTDAWKITDQFLADTKNGSSFSLSSLQVSLPTFVVSDYKKNFQVTIDERGHLNLNLIKNGEVVATHQIKNIDAFSVTYDDELMIVIRNDGRMMASDMIYLKESIFKGPIPFFDIGRVPTKYLSKTLNSEFITSSMKPIERLEIVSDAVVPELRKWNAGDIAVKAEFPSRKIFKILERDNVKMQIATGQGVLSTLLASYLPAESQAIINSGAALITEQDPLTSEALQAFGPNQLKTLQTLAFRNSAPNEQLKDQFTFEEWKKEFEAASLPKPKEKKVPILKKIFNPQSMKKLALAVGGVFGIGAAIYTQHDQAWAIHLVNEIYNDYWPDVLKDQTYRITLLKSTLWLSSFIPILYGVGTFFGKKDWSFKKTLASYGIKIYAHLSRPFFHYIADLTRQPLVLKSMQLGLSPLKNAVGFINPFQNSKSFNDDKNRKSAELTTRIDQKKRLTAIAWMITHAVVSKRTGIDPVTLSTFETDKEAAKNKDFFDREWKKNAIEVLAVYQQLLDKGKLNEDLKHLSPTDIAEFYRIANETAEKISKRSGAAQTIAYYRNAWKEISGETAKNIASFGLDEFNYLKGVEPNHFVTEMFWQQFIVDYALTVDQIALFGPRADLNAPEALAAQEGAPLSTNPAHLVDMVDQIRAYMLSVPSLMAMVYQRQPSLLNVKTRAALNGLNEKLTDPTYNPREQKEKPAEKSKSYIQGILSWFKNSLNIPKANYGSLYLRSFVKKVKTVQAQVILTMIVGRMLVAHQNVDDAFWGFVYYFIWGTWSYAWFWEPVNRGIQMDMDEIDRLNKELQNATTLIKQGERLNEAEKLKLGYEQLQGLFELSLTSAPEDLKEALKEIENTLNLPESERLSRYENIKKYFGYLARLKLAMDKEDVAGTKAAYDDLIAAYRESGQETTELMKLNAASLRDYALKHPPVFTKGNSAVQWTNTLTGALTTTYLASFLMVDSFSEKESWPLFVAKTAAMSAALYGATYGGQKLINHIAANWENMKKLICAEKVNGR